MGEYLAAHSKWGEILAKSNWVKCSDPDNLSSNSKDLEWSTRKIKKECKQIELHLVNVLQTTDMKLLIDECMKIRDECMEKYECELILKYKPIHATFNVGALRIMTDKIIPVDIKFGLSLGWKFLFPYVTSNENIHSILAQLEDCIEQTIPDVYLSRTYQQVAKVIRNRHKIQYNDEMQWLRFISLRSDRFFKENLDIFATKSDKGGHTVVIDTNRYELEINKMLDNEVYERLEDSPLDTLVNLECKLIKFISGNNKTKSDEDIKRYRLQFQPNLLQLAKFYGLPKVHKRNFCLRPIMSLIGAPGFATGKIFDLMLKTIFPRTEYHIRDSLKLKEFLSEITLEKDYILVSFDVVSMFTSIPRTLVNKIVMDKADSFLHLFGMGKKILQRFLKFLLEESTIFTACDTIHKQNKGLPMGSCISPTLARITMDKVVLHLLQRVPEIAFIRVFVDDTITAIHKNSVKIALDTLNNFDENIKFTLESERTDGSIDFLNMTLIRRDDKIVTNWYKKGFASGRLLNFLSQHKKTTILETAINFIITIRTLSDGEFFQSNKIRVINTLRENSFPETLIISLMNEHYTLMRTRRKPVNKAERFAVYPHAVCESSNIKRILHKYRDNKFAYSDSTRNSKINHVRTRKTFTPKKLRGNTIVISRCTCRKKYKIIATGRNQNAEMLINTIKTSFVKCTRSLHAFRRFKIQKGLAYGSQTNILARYIQWQYRGSFLNTRTGRPEYHMAKILNTTQ